MVKYWRELSILILILIILLISNSLFNSYNKVSLLSNKLDNSQQLIKTYVNKNGELVSQVKVDELTIQDLKKIGVSLGYDNKSLKRQVGSLSNLVGFWKGKAVSQGRDTIVLTDTVYLDIKGNSVTNQKIEWTNKYLSLNGIYSPEQKKIDFDYKYDLGQFELITYKKHKQLVADIKFEDPNLKLTEFSSVVIKQPRKKFYQRNVFWFIVGIAGGFYITK